MQFASNPSSKWLDRLRRSKGFPANSGEDLDHFLSHQNTHLPNPKKPQIITNPNQVNPVNRDLTSVLFDLFNFGESNDDPLFNSKKGIRKQKKPRFCVVSKKSDEAENERVTREEKEEENNGDFGEGCDFVGFSRTNETVIDTSYYPWWKCEKVVFRKKSLWKVRDRKSKSTNIGGKKRKTKTLEDENDGSRKKFKLFGSSEEGNKQNETVNTNIEESDDTLGQVQNQRFPRKSKKGGASNGVLIKKTLTSKKNGIISLKTDGS